MKYLYCIFGIFCMMISLYEFALGQQTIAYVSKLKGVISVVRANEEKFVIVTLADHLYEGDSLIVEDGSNVTLKFFNGEDRTFLGRKSILISKNSLTGPTSSLRSKLFAIILAKLDNSLVEVKKYQGGVRSLDRNKSLITPQRCYVSYSAIYFRWQNYPDIEKYKFYIMEQEPTNEPIYTKIVEDTTILIFPDSLRLSRGIRYYWKVELVGTVDNQWDSSWFQVYTYNQESDFLHGQKEVMDLYGRHAEQALIAYYDAQKAYHLEYEYLFQLLQTSGDNTMYYIMMTDVLSKMGVSTIARDYANKASSLR